MELGEPIPITASVPRGVACSNPLSKMVPGSALVEICTCKSNTSSTGSTFGPETTSMISKAVDVVIDVIVDVDVLEVDTVVLVVVVFVVVVGVVLVRVVEVPVVDVDDVSVGEVVVDVMELDVVNDTVDTDDDVVELVCVVDV